uniref:ARAD1D31152p n=1 Tax=Blastobotrys adeninivorans TaxID=409370 RepID=A0A060TB20_BLAAD
MSYVQDVRLARDYVGKQVHEVPVPALILDRRKIHDNASKLLEAVSRQGINFRVHVETLKATEAVREALNHGRGCNAVVVSTLEEIRNLVSLVEEGVVTDVLYGTPIGRSQAKELAYLKNLFANLGATLRFVVDNVSQVNFLLENSSSWSVLAKVDAIDLIRQSTETSNGTTNGTSDGKMTGTVNGRQASEQDGSNSAIDATDTFTTEFQTLINTLVNEPRYHNVQLFGFYCHAGASCGTNDVSITQAHVDKELDMLIKASRFARKVQETRQDRIIRKATLVGSNPDRVLTPSPHNTTYHLLIGATPTIHDFTKLPSRERMHSQDVVEFHAGSYLALDLRQVSGDVSKDQIAVTVTGEVCSFHPTRREYIINVGVLALSRESGFELPGIAHIRGVDDWIVTKVYQEYGVVSYVGKQANPKLPFEIGDLIELYPQNACITSSNHRLYFVVDGSDTVVEIWKPWRYW